MANVLIYTTPWCAPCTQTKKYLTHLGVEYTAIDISENQTLRREIFDKAHAVTVPIVQRGSKFCVGYNPQKIKELVL